MSKVIRNLLENVAFTTCKDDKEKQLMQWRRPGHAGYPPVTSETLMMPYEE
jgi:hypothetical protein